MVPVWLSSEVVLLSGQTSRLGLLSPGYLELISKGESLFLQHVQNAAVLLLDRLPLHQLQISFVNFIL